MDARFENCVHGPHLPNTVRENLPEVLREIESAIEDFVGAGKALLRCPNHGNVQRVWVCNRLAWCLLLPYRHLVLKEKRFLVKEFRTLVAQVHDFLREEESAEEEMFERLREDLARRESLLSALLAEDGESRIRDLLTAERIAAGVG